MESLLRNRPTLDRIQLAESKNQAPPPQQRPPPPPLAESTASTQKKKQRKRKAKKEAIEAEKSSRKQQKQATKSTALSLPVIASPAAAEAAAVTSKIPLPTKVTKKAPESIAPSPSSSLPSYANKTKPASKSDLDLPKMVSGSVPKRKRDERSSKSRKKSRKSRKKASRENHRVRSRSRAPSIETESDSESSSSSSASSSEDSSSDSSTDSEEERRRRRRARSRSRSRARERGRSRSRARYASSDDSDDDDDDGGMEGGIAGSELVKPIFMAFTVPEGKTHMRPVKFGTPFPKLMETVYALSNISQIIPLELSYVMNGLTLQLNDEEDFKALLEAAQFTNEMVQVRVKKVEPTKPPKVKENPRSSPPRPNSNKTVKDKQKKSEKTKKAAQKVEKQPVESPILVAKNRYGDRDSSEEIPLSTKKTVNGAPSTISVETSEDVPLAKILIKEPPAASPAKESAPKDIPARTEASEKKSESDLTTDQTTVIGEAPKEKRKRRSREEIEEHKALTEQKKAEKKAAAEKKKAEEKQAAEEKESQNKRAAEEKKAAKKAARQAAKATESSPEKPNSGVQAKDSPSPAVKNTDATDAKDTAKDTKAKATNGTSPEKDKSTKAGDKPITGQAELTLESPSKSAKKSATATKSSQEDTDTATAALQPKGKEGGEKATASTPKKRKAEEDTTPACDICFSKEHERLRCPVIQGGRPSIRKRLEELKGKGRKKTRPENDACKVLERWIKTDDENQRATIEHLRKDNRPPTFRTLAEARAHYERERLEDLQEQQEMTAALERERARLNAERAAKEKSGASLSPSKARDSVRDIMDKVKRDREGQRLGQIEGSGLLGDGTLKATKSVEADDNSSEVDQLANSQLSPPQRLSYPIKASTASRVSPTASESELATSPMLMADNDEEAKANADIKEGVALPPPAMIPNGTTEKHLESNDDSSSDTSIDSDDERGLQGGKSSEEGEDEIEDEQSGEEGKRGKGQSSAREGSEAISSSSGGDNQEENEVVEDEVDEIEATPAESVNNKSGNKGGWMGGITTMLGFGSQDSATARPRLSNESIKAPPSAQIPKTPVATAATNNTPARLPPSSQRPKLAGGARLSQLDTSALKTSFSQPGTPRSAVGTPQPSATPSTTQKKSMVDFDDSDSHSEGDDDDDSDSDSDHQPSSSSLPANKQAGQKKKPRASLLSRFNNF